MNHTFFSDIAFETKQLQKQKVFSRKNSSDMHPNNIHVNIVRNSCLLGSLEFNPKQKPNDVGKFQIVQLSKSRRKPIKQKSLVSTLLQTESKIKQAGIYQSSFKVKKLERCQIGLMQNNFSVALIENAQVQRSPCDLQIQKVTFTCRNPSVNLEKLPLKFTPNQTFCPQRSQQLFHNKKQGFYASDRQFRKANLDLNLYPQTFSLSESKQLQGNNKNRRQSLSQKSDFQTLKTKNLSTKTNKPTKSFFNQQKQYQDSLQIEKKRYMQIRKEINKNYGKPFNPPQKISAQAYIVYEITKQKFKYRNVIDLKKEKKKFSNSHKVLAEYNSRTPCQVASLTKIMTFLVALQISKKYSLLSSEQLIEIGNFEQKINGTSANLRCGEIYTLEQLFYGLMLPSGNDASLAIAVWGGQALMKNSQNQPFQEDETLFKKKKMFYDRFLEEMNKKAIQLGMQKTHFANSHGLSNSESKSCAFDLALLCEEALKNPKFKQVVQTRNYECTIKCEKQDLSTINSPTYSKCQRAMNYNSQDQMEDYIESYNQSEESENPDKVNQKNVQTQKTSNEEPQKNYDKKIVWQNTHLLLHQKPILYKGIKTGVTNTAGPCLASFVESNERQFLFIVLNCKTMKQRFRDTENLRKWAFQKEHLKAENS